MTNSNSRNLIKKNFKKIKINSGKSKMIIIVKGGQYIKIIKSGNINNYYIWRARSIHIRVGLE